MCDCILYNKSIDAINYETFKIGLSELNAIQKNPSHSFHKNVSIYSLDNYVQLVQNYGQTEQVLVKFIEQLKCLEKEIYSEHDADYYFPNGKNSFLGVDFRDSTISEAKQITDNDSYTKWCYSILTSYEKLKIVLGKPIFYHGFIKLYNALPCNVQDSIVDEFEKAKNRKLKTPFYPDTKIIKDVTHRNFKIKVMELRVYTPTALRIYFSEIRDIVYIAFLGLKSNTSQDSDIKKAYKILSKLLKLSV